MEERCVSCAEWPAKLRKGVRIIDIPPAIVAYVMGRSKRGKRFMTPEQLKARYNDGDLDKSEYEEYDVATAVKGANSRDAIATDDLLSLAMDVTGLSKEELLKKPDPKEGDRAGDDDDNGSSSEGWSDFEEGENEEEDQVFREWGATVDAAISALGGEAFPKLNWSAPKDAVWISGEGTLRCRTHLDVLMLLKSSDFAAADIAQAEAMGVKPVLVLKPWRNVTTASEYRCFVMKRRLVAICQRHVNDCYNLSSEAKQEIEFVVRNYINSSVVPFVPPALNSFVADIWMENINSIHLIDLATLKGDEDYQLISYPEIVAVSNAMEQDRSIQPELRVPDESIGVQPSSRNLYGVPVEIRDARTMEDLINAMQREEYKMKQGQQQNKEGEKK